MTEEKIKPLYTKEFTRDFCLPIIETWCKGESTVPRQWTQNQQPRQPYLIFQNENEVVSCYMDEKGIDWVKSELENMMKSDSTYFAGVLETFMQKITRINPILVEEKTLNRVELIEFLDHLLDSWPWFEAFWWLVKVVEKDKMRFEQIKKVRLESERLAPSSDRVIRKSLLKIYPQLKELSSFLLVDEIKSNQLPSQEQLHARMKSFIYTNDTLFMGKSLNEIQKRFHIQIEQPNLPKTQAVNQIHGISAFGGVVKGKVKIVKSTRDLSKVHSGDILVAPMTIPSFIPAMERASAFITDEGGILCHAAIVSREMRKPCIIGTRNATQWLKDGDEVEVDGDNGTVKLVNPVITNEKDSIYINEVYWKLVVTRNMSFWHQYNSNIGHVFH